MAVPNSLVYSNITGSGAAGTFGRPDDDRASRLQRDKSSRVPRPVLRSFAPKRDLNRPSQPAFPTSRGIAANGLFDRRQARQPRAKRW
jgi:hypothetical protein